MTLDSRYVIDDPVRSSQRVWRVAELSDDGSPLRGPILVTFDKRTIFNLWTDFPSKFTPEQIQIMREEEPYWYEFFMPRLEEA
ncbi:hypothetical protein HMPREF9241_01104 [Schaalia turicensis ACS-279-V-Col4]|uniref:DUF7675 domain-containing protein n=1 Tax=Schaalia turicensis ACS-279-V-Col4 TaxID=883077 RepID=K0Z2X9_9ACTO|nr:hypothetical protein HMPREF9241_01104 [Schaalia turicensis ACS-279-V-Col4]